MKNVYCISDKKFKAIGISLNFTMNVEKSDISKNAVLASILRKTNSKYKTQKEIESYLESLYGASFNVNVEKIGDVHNTEFKVECINDATLQDSKNTFFKCLEFLKDIVYNPVIGTDKLCKETLDREKQYIIEKIKEIKDDKRQNAIARSLELMYPELPFGSLVYGSEEDVNKIDVNDINLQYNKLINNSKITLIITGNLENYGDLEDMISDVFEDRLNKNFDVGSLQINKVVNGKLKSNNIAEIIEEQDTNQSALTFIIENNSKEDDYLKSILYNAVLGGNPASKLFQNFREKESLAYTVISQYYRYKKMFLIYAGIKKSDFSRAKEVVIEQLADIVANNITDIEFLAAKRNLISDIKNWNDSKGALSRLILVNVILGAEPKINIEEIVTKLEGYTKEDIVELAQHLEVKQIYLLGGRDDA